MRVIDQFRLLIAIFIFLGTGLEYFCNPAFNHILSQVLRDHVGILENSKLITEIGNLRLRKNEKEVEGKVREMHIENVRVID